jgi:hypothetical protein
MASDSNDVDSALPKYVGIDGLPCDHLAERARNPGA